MPDTPLDIKGYLREVTLMDDSFINICLHDNIPSARAMLSHIMGRRDINITKVETQKKLPGFGRSLVLDLYTEEATYTICNDKEDVVYNVETQNDDRGAIPKRVRYHCGMIDVHYLKKSQDFDELPESYVIFITKNDVLKQGRTMYTINRYIDGTGERFDDGQHIIYVNCSAEDDGSEIWKLIHDMTCKNPDEMLIPELAERVSYFKNTQKGETEVTDYFKDVIREREEAVAAKAQREKEGFVSNIIKAGVMTLDKIAEAFNMPLTDVEALAGKVNA